MKSKKLLPLNLQLFNEEPPAVNPEPVVIGPGNPEFDSAVSKAVETALSNNDKKWQSKLEEQLAAAKEAGKTEAEKMAQMNAEQLAEFQRQQQEEALTKREQEITVRELRAQSMTQLAEAKLPADLVDVLDLTDGDKCQESFNKVKVAWEKANGTWDESLQKAVNAKLASSVDDPLGGAAQPTGKNPWAKDSFNLTEQGKIMMSDPEKAKILMAQAKKK